MQLQSGTLLQSGRYRIISTLGNGGFGITYLAEQCMTERKVCIKEFFPKGYYTRQGDSNAVRISSPEFDNNMVRFKAKFIKEAKTIARLDHPNIVHIFDAFEENDTAYYVMEYIEGESLSSITKRLGVLAEAEAVKYISQIADALRYIHEQRIMHLDVKPGNIMVRQQDARSILIDFGLSKHYDESSGEATSTTPVGVSHGYAPMEQYRTGGVKSFSPETDIYSLGATLYYLVTGTTPPEAAEIADDGLPTLPSHLSSGVRNTIERSMESQRKSRPHSIGEFLALLDDCDKSSEVELTISPALESDNTLILDSQTSSDDKTIISNESLLPPTNEIWYTSSDGKIVTPFNTEEFIATIVSNTYNNGKGVIKFSGDVTKIERSAFWGCSSLTSVNIPSSVTTIGWSAFRGCSSLTSVNIPNSVTKIENYAFLGCSSLKEFKGKFTSADGRCLIIDNKLIAFAPAGLKEYIIPNSVTTIGMSAFSGCSSLTSINIPNSVTKIERGAFRGCSSLTSVTIPNSVTTIGNFAFPGCSSLKEFKGKFASADGRCLIIDNKLIAFAPAGQKEYIIPNSVTTIEDCIFFNCSSLTSVNIPNSVTTIGDRAFWGCSSLTSINIPNSVTKIEWRAFAGCDKLPLETKQKILKINPEAFGN